jgi:hypothetical protein
VQILEWFVQRWTVEVTFEEARAHLGVETQRQWTEKAIARMTPALFALYSVVTLLAARLLAADRLPVRRAAWYAVTGQTGIFTTSENILTQLRQPTKAQR